VLARRLNNKKEILRLILVLKRRRILLDKVELYLQNEDLRDYTNMKIAKFYPPDVTEPLLTGKLCISLRRSERSERAAT